MKSFLSDSSLLSDQTKFWLNQINKVINYFNSEIQERKTMSKKLSKYIAAFDCIDKILYCFIWNKWRNKYCFFYECHWNYRRNNKCKFYFNIFFLTIGIIKKLLKKKQERKKKHNKIIMLAKSKLNSIEILVSQALIDLDKSNEEFKANVNVNEKEKYDQMKESIINTKSKDKLSENSGDIRKNSGNA